MHTGYIRFSSSLCFSGWVPNLGLRLSGVGLLANVTLREVPLQWQHVGWLCINIGLVTKHHDRKTLIEVRPAG